MFVLNLATQPGETDGFRASDHIKAVFGHSADGIVDTILVNTERLSGDLEKNYQEAGSPLVEIDEDALVSLNLSIVKKDLLAAGEFARHDPKKLREAILELMKTAVEKI